MLWIFGIGYYVGDRMGFKKYDEIEKIKNLWEENDYYIYQNSWAVGKELYKKASMRDALTREYPEIASRCFFKEDNVNFPGYGLCIPDKK
jgi:hypothetical protein